MRRFSTLLGDRVEPVNAGDVEAAAVLADRQTRTGERLSARDLLHAAVMERAGAEEIISADRGFDDLPRLKRLDPSDLATWRADAGL